MDAGELLDETVVRLRTAEQPLRKASLSNKCTVVVDGWDDIERNHPVNIPTGTCKGFLFRGTKHLTSLDHKDAQSVADVIMRGMKLA
eukprot:2512286-Pleurochrysis_carterae.AAC.1